ncbi:MAG: hypothetical protein GY937_10220 [bacterium]|nr:hypothetical protein [bacterium]
MEAATEPLQLIDFWNANRTDLTSARPDSQLFKACEFKQGFIFRECTSGEIHGCGAVFQYLAGHYHEAGLARISDELGGYGKAEWGFTLHEFLHRYRALSSFASNQYLTRYFGIVDSKNDNNWGKLLDMGFRQWPSEPPPLLVDERNHVLSRVRNDDQTEPLAEEDRKKIWLVLEKDQVPALADQLLKLLKLGSRCDENRKGLRFKLSRYKCKRDEAGHFVRDENGHTIRVKPAQREEMILHVNLRLLTEERELLDTIAGDTWERVP